MSVRSLLPLAGLLALACNGDVKPADSGDTNDTNTTVGNITLDPCDWDFGLVEVGAITSKSFAAENTGGQAVTIQSIEVAAPFTVSATTPIDVGGGNSYQFSVRFEPSEYGSFEQTLTLTSNDPDSPSITCVLSGEVEGDADGDGYLSAEAGGDDCDDDDPRVHPGAEESWYDGIDSDCDGADDFDQDGDGYQSWVFNEDPEGGGGDCQDVDPDIHPGAADEWYDGVDSDCDGGDDYDMDGDGYPAKSYGGTDCNDEDPDVNPDGVESFNRLDDDCDGVVDNNASADESDVLITGETAGDSAGHGIAVGDWDNDGIDELAIGIHYDGYAETGTFTGDAQGAFSIFGMDVGSYTDEVDDYAGGTNLVSDAPIYVDGETATDELGYTLSNLGDFDGDDVEDLAVVAGQYNSRAGKIYIFSGASLATTTTISDAIVTLEGKDDYRIGSGLASEIDMNGDGNGDVLAMGMNSYQPEINLSLQYGGSSVTGDLGWTDIDATWVMKCGTAVSSFHTCGPPSASSASGGTPEWAYQANGGADLDGDGYQDAILGDRYNDDGDYANVGRVWILWGRSAKYTNSNSSLNSTGTLVAEGTYNKNYLGGVTGVSTDVNGDGAAEVWISDLDKEVLYFLYGGSDLRVGNLDLESEAAATFDFNNDTVNAISNPGDWSGDGVDDIMITAGESKGGYSKMLASQEYAGFYKIDDVIIGSIYGGDQNASFGMGVPLIAGDLDGNGYADLVFGDWEYEDSSGDVYGSAQVFFNAGG